MQSLKSLIRSTSRPLAQAAKRIEERETAELVQRIGAENKCKISPKGRDSTLYLKSGKFATVLEVRRETLLCEVYKRQSLQPFYSEPCSSDLLNIFSLKSNVTGSIKEVAAASIQCKGLKLPHGNGFLIPLLHQEEA